MQSGPPKVEQPVRRSSRQISVKATEVELADAAFLELVARGDNGEAISMLKKGQQVNVADEKGETAVHKATKRGDVNFVGQLLKLGAVADYPDMDGMTPIMVAVQYGLTSLVEDFMKKNVNLLAKTVDGRTLLHIAAYSGHEETMRTLLQIGQVGALLEAKDAQGRTPLQVASYRSSHNMCTMLVTAGADYATLDKRGNDCATLAGRSGRRKSREFFEKLAAPSAPAAAERA